MHMAIGAVVNAVWDLAAKRAGKPLWQLLADADARVARRPGRLPLPHRRPHPRRGAATCCARGRAGPRRSASALLLERGYPAYTTSPGWLGYSDEKLTRLAKRGRRRRLHPDQAEGRRRPRRRRAPHARRPRRRRRRTSASPSTPTSAGTSTRRSTGCSALAEFDPYWIEEPTSPDDILGHAAIRRAVGPGQGRHRRARPEPHRLQAAAPGRRHRRPADRRGPGRRRQREPRDPAAGRQVRRAGLPARRRRRPVRAGPAPVDVRLRGAVRHHRGPGHRVRRPPARALRRPGGDPRGPLHRARRARASPPPCSPSRSPSTATPTARSGPPTSRTAGRTGRRA